MTSLAPDSRLERLPTGIAGLDTILGGGFFRSGVYIVHGLPGSGKTILGNQLCYNHVKGGGRAVYVTLLAESHSRMLQHIRGLGFFDEQAIPDKLAYISAFHQLESDGLRGLMDTLRREMRARNVGVLVLDGLVAAAEAAQSDRELKKFIHEVQTSAVFNNCTVFMLTSGSPQRISAEHTMVDGLVELEEQLFEVRSERSIRVRKFRGASSLRGKHSFRIDDDGISVFPRLESLYGAPPDGVPGDGGLSTGVPTLDGLISQRGYPRASCGVVVGSTGTGKTTLGLHFLAGSTPEEPGLWFGFYESPARLCQKAASFGIDLAGLEARGAVELHWRSQSEHILDQLGQQLLDAVSARRIRRVVIDGISGFFESAVHMERINRFFSCLANELRRRGATVLMTLETRDAVSSVVSVPYGVSGFVDNLLFLRFVEDRGRALRLLTLIKMRDSAFDSGLHRLEIGPTGMRIAGLYSSGADVIPSAQPVEPTRAATPSPPSSSSATRE